MKEHSLHIHMPRVVVRPPRRLLVIVRQLQGFRRDHFIGLLRVRGVVAEGHVCVAVHDLC